MIDLSILSAEDFAQLCENVERPTKDGILARDPFRMFRALEAIEAEKQRRGIAP